MVNAGNSGWAKRTFILVALLCVAVGVALGETGEEKITFTKEKRGKVSSIFANNPHAFPVTVTLQLSEESENVRMTPQDPVTSVIAARSKRKVATIQPVRRSKRWSYNYKYFSKYGDARRKHDPETVYRLPYAKGDSYRLVQGVFGDFSHQDKVAYDFGLPEGTEICAAREGRVVRMIQHYTEGGPDKELKSKANVIFVLHEDNSIAAYYHLMHNGSRVELGDEVQEGQVIGLSGNTGYSRGPHLHFEVFRPLDGKTMSTVPLRFFTSDGLVDDLVKDESYINPDKSRPKDNR